MISEKELFEEKPILKAILNLALPSILGQIILVIYNMADTFFVGMTKSDSMITAVTVCMPAFMFLSAISNLFGVGGASVISRSLGKNDRDKAIHASQFAVWGCLLTTLAYCLLSFLFVDTFVDLLGGSNFSVHQYSRAYMLTAVILGGIPTALNTLLSHLIRAEGRSFQASLGIAIGGILNVALDPLFMFVLLKPGQEALGAAVATALSNLCALFYYIIVLIRQKDKLIFSARPSREMLREKIPIDVISVGIPACLMTLCENISYAILDNLMAAAGTAAQAGIGVAKKVNMLAHSIVRGMSQGVLPLIGFNFASGNRTRMKKVIFTSGGISIFISLLCMTASLLFSEPLIYFFIRIETESLTFGIKFLRILCIGAPFSALAYSAISFFQAVGKSLRSLLLALLRKGICDIPLMFILNSFFKTYGIVWATPIADMVCCIISIIVFRNFIRHHTQDTLPSESLPANS